MIVINEVYWDKVYKDIVAYKETNKINIKENNIFHLKK
jgi:hypothetical protein